MAETIRKTEYAVVGSGPGGASVAMRLAQAGKKVALLERGREHNWIGNHLSALLYTDKAGMNFSEEGLHVVRALMLGGSTIVYCGSASRPPDWLKTKYKIDLDTYADETIAELDLKPLPDEVIGTAGMRLLAAGDEAGHGFERMAKFIDPQTCRSRCGGTCMLGCPYGAKWDSRRYVREMERAGGETITRARVDEITHEDGVATGLMAQTPQGRLRLEAQTVILAAGGIGTPSILQRSGIHEAGVGMFIDPLVFVTGISRHPGTALGPPMAIGTYKYNEEGILLSDLMDPWLLWAVMALRANPAHILDWFRYRRMMGLMVKIGDERRGFITMSERISKPMSEQDRYRLNRGAAISREVLIRAGCDPESIIVGPVRGAHPGGTARIGEVVDTDLQTRIKGLYVADASAIPEALDRPVVLTAICLGKRLAQHLLAQSSADNRAA